MRSRRPAGGGSETKAENLVSALTSPVQGEGKTLKEVVSNIDAPNTGSRSAAFKVGGTLAGIEGGGVNIASGGGGDLGTLGGDSAAIRASGKLGAREGKEEKGKGKVRGKVQSLKALAKVEGSLSRGEVQEVINKNLGKIQGCYERALLNKPTLGGKLTFEWTVATSGSVSDAREQSSTLNDQGVSKCILGVIKGMKFPKPKGGEVTIRYPFVFQTQS